MRNISIKPKSILRQRGGYKTIKCPKCDEFFQYDEKYLITDDYCGKCGKILDSRFHNYCANCGCKVEMEKDNG